MNKRQRKKEQKKQDMFASAFVSSYRELKEIDRSYHEYIVSIKRKKYDEDWTNNIVDKFNEIPYTSFWLTSEEIERLLNKKE